MYLITNRQLHRDKKGVDVLGPDTYHEDATRIRLVEAKKVGRRWQVEVLPDQITAAMKEEVGITDTGAVYASRYVLHRLRSELKRKKRNLLFFVHGYNNNMQAVLDRAAKLEDKYKVSVLTFTWPARGGGIRGTLSYRSDKAAAEESAPAFERVLERFGEYVRGIEDEREQRILKSLSDEVAEDGEACADHMIKAAHEECPFRISMMAHSMGCYLVRKVFDDFTPPPDFSFLDNITLLAADTNNRGHGQWVDQLNPRQGVYITMNQNDSALSWSERKMGRRQRPRLGRIPRNFEAAEAVYVDVSNLAHISDRPEAHAYFEDAAIDGKGNPAKLKRFFRNIFHGKAAEQDLKQQAEPNVFRIV